MPANVTIRLSLAERVATATVTSCFCLIFLYVNGVMLYTLRSKRLFRETSRYILMYHLLLGDTLLLAITQLLYLLTTGGVTLTYPVCGVLIMLNNAVSRNPPLVLVVMSLERYVAVCHPLRHASIITVRNTAVAVLVVWVLCFLNELIQGLLLMMFPFEQLESLHMTRFCNYLNLLLVPILEYYYKVYTYFLFIAASLSIMFSFVGVTVAARSAAPDKDSARKARNTLLLHLLQLGLCLLSVLYVAIMALISSLLSHLMWIRVQTVSFVFFFLLPRCLTSLVYGLRDKSLRVVLVYHLCCHLKMSGTAVKTAPAF
ncbi:odorant receptor 131-2-like [Vanacampus margaritifer]